MKKKIIAIVLIIVVISSLFVGCTYEQTAEEKQTNATKKILNEINNQVGMPDIKEFYEKKLAKEVLELRDNSKLITYVYTQGMSGKFIYIGKAMGYGLPYSTQYTSPQQFVRIRPTSAYSDSGSLSWSDQVMPQAEPNGLYMPDSASATWIMLINEQTGKREVMYLEPNAIVTQSKLPKRLVEEWSLPQNY